ncbi:MAG: GNAT family N-acetyltransferase [Oscillospiraceae bacterium]|nr:GNAT family N-acetyltransferase [Oscillospiraceae bacterium]
MVFEYLKPEDVAGIAEMSAMATEIVREHFDPIIGKAQNDYMLQKFQTADAIRDQLVHGYQYFFVSEDGRTVGFLAFYPKEEAMYLSKLYLYKTERGKGYSRQMVDFVARKAREAGLPAIELNVNRDNSAVRAYERLGFQMIRTEKNDIGEGFFMDDFVFRLEL